MIPGEYLNIFKYLIIIYIFLIPKFNININNIILKILLISLIIYIIKIDIILGALLMFGLLLNIHYINNIHNKIELYENAEKIPKIIYFCNKNISEKDLLSANNWKVLNPEYEIKLYDDEMIGNYLLLEYGQLYKNIFNFIQDGPIKADFWRLCILYKTGGVYSDIDNLPLVPLSSFIDKDVDFVTCSSYINYSFNPNFIMSTKNNIILKNCIDWYINKYNNKDKYEYWEWSIMNNFTHTLHLENYTKNWGIYNLDNMKIQIIEECPGMIDGEYDKGDSHNIYNNIRVFNNRQPGWNHELHKFD